MRWRDGAEVSELDRHDDDRPHFGGAVRYYYSQFMWVRLADHDIVFPNMNKIVLSNIIWIQSSGSGKKKLIY